MNARRTMRAALLVIGGLGNLAAAPIEPAFKVLSGPMPILPGRTSVNPGLGTLAPVPNYDLDAPQARADGRARLEPGIIDRDGRRRTDAREFAPESGFSMSLERKSRPLNGFGNTLAPSVILRVPLK